MAKIYGERWEIASPLDEGGQSHTYLVKDKKGMPESRYVLKRLKNIKRIERFKREIEAIRNLAHENILKLLDFDLDTPKPFLVTEYCVEGSLPQAETNWKGSIEKSLNIFIDVCKGVLHAHNNDIIHRDIKPENIFLRSPVGPAVVGDFGICYFDREGERLTLTEEAVGPRLFIAPELEDGRIDEISDLSDTYSLGKLLYWLLSGGKAFSREKHRDQKYDLKGHNPLTPGGWDNIFMEHANRLLDSMITDDPKSRINVNEVLEGAIKVQKLIGQRYNPISKNIKQPCTYCGYGYYQLQAVSSTDVRNFGFNTVGRSEWRIYSCEMCGHVQTFRLDYAKMKDWWL
ncbi:MAG: eukaryotic-like serine/threonine-protein kinase [Desulfobacteraceae bacterium Eth-SRB2]|nr:MAG: eukaryotic-like serine/threonine-protein kinase [Desulfobacteraceae bacterium Eth-SRB2]